jgi:hypothetical protein
MVQTRIVVIPANHPHPLTVASSEVIIIAMSKRNKRPVSLGAAVAMSLVAAVIAGVVFIVVASQIPNTSINLYINYVVGDRSPDPGTGVLFGALRERMGETLTFWASPISMFAGGIALGWRLGNEYGVRRLWTWAAICSAATNILGLVIVWALKLNAQSWHLNPTDITSSIVVEQIFALILWVGFYVGGAEVGRHFHKAATPRAATA